MNTLKMMTSWVAKLKINKISIFPGFLSAMSKKTQRAILQHRHDDRMKMSDASRQAGGRAGGRSGRQAGTKLFFLDT